MNPLPLPDRNRPFRVLLALMNSLNPPAQGDVEATQEPPDVLLHPRVPSAPNPIHISFLKSDGNVSRWSQRLTIHVPESEEGMLEFRFGLTTKGQTTTVNSRLS